MANQIRVLRLLEYVYDSVESMEKDMARWGVPANGSHVIRGGLNLPHTEVIKSAVLPLEVLKQDEADRG